MDFTQNLPFSHVPMHEIFYLRQLSSHETGIIVLRIISLIVIIKGKLTEVSTKSVYFY